MSTIQSETTDATAVRVAVRVRSGSSVRNGNAIRLGLLLTICGCGYDTSIYGMYFPSWVVAPAVGAGLAVLTLAGIARTRLATYVPTGVLVFTSLTLIWAVLVWALFFEA